MGLFKRKDSPFWWMWVESTGANVRVPGPIRHSGGDPDETKELKALALHAYRKALHDGAAAKSGIKVVTMPATFRLLAEWYRDHKVPLNRGADREREIIATLIAAFGKEPIAAITKDRVSEWITERLTTKRIAKKRKKRGKTRTLPAPTFRTVNREVDVLKAILKAGVPKYLAQSPIAGMPRLKGATPRRRLLTPAEEARLQRELAPEDWALFLVGMDGLCRLGDILDVRWADDRGACLYIAHPKLETPYTVPVSSRLRTALEAVPKTGVYIFAHRRRAEPKYRRNVIRKMFQEACRRANVPYGRKVGLTWHWATRRTGASRMLAGGASVPAVQRVGDWKTSDTLLGIYAEAMTPELAAAVELVGQDVPKNGDAASAPPTQEPQPAEKTRHS